MSSPDDIDLVKRSPGYRRAFLDMALSQVSREYLVTLQRYTRALAHRNVLLKRAQETRTVPGGDRGVGRSAGGVWGRRWWRTGWRSSRRSRRRWSENVSAMSGAATTVEFVYEPRGYDLAAGWGADGAGRRRRGRVVRRGRSRRGAAGEPPRWRWRVASRCSGRTSMISSSCATGGTSASSGRRASSGPRCWP